MLLRANESGCFTTHEGARFFVSNTYCQPVSPNRPSPAPYRS